MNRRNGNRPAVRGVQSRGPVGVETNGNGLVVPRSSARRRFGTSQDFVSAVQSVIVNALNRPLFLVTVLLAIVFLSTYTKLDEGPISKVLPKNSTNDFVVWARNNVGKFFGGVVFVPAVVDSPPRNRVFLACLVAVWIFVVPEASYKEYAIQAVALHLFNHLRNPQHRVIVVFVVVAAYFLGFIVFKK